MTKHPLAIRAILALGVLLGAAPALAQDAVPGFSIQSIDGTDGVSLDSAFGTTSGSTDHNVNLTQCESYVSGGAEFRVRFDSVSANSEIKVALSTAGNACSTGTFDDLAETDECKIVENGDTFTTSTASYTFTVPFADLLGTCSTDEQGTAKVYVLISSIDYSLNFIDADHRVSEIDIEVDFQAPTAPTNATATAGDSRVTLSWDESDDADVEAYAVYWSEATLDQAAIDAEDYLGVEDGISTTSFDVTDLLNGTEYQFAVAALDGAGNESGISDVVTATPIETVDFWESYQSAGGTEEGGFCFIATAAYGTPMATELDSLRAFRDRVLMASSGGRAFVDGYYAYGRFPAAWMADKPVLRAVVRVLLTPLVWFADLALAFGPFGALAVLAMAAMLLEAIRRRWVAHVLRNVPSEARA